MSKKIRIPSRDTITTGEPRIQSGPGKHRVHYSSRTDEWYTPQSFFTQMVKMFGPFDLDVCATPDNAKCDRFFTRKQDGLSQSWAPSRVWMNPPYGRAISEWMRKAWDESQRGAFVVCLVPARTDTAWWHDYAAKGQVHLIRGRLKFGGQTNSAPFPSAIIIFPAVCAHEQPARDDTTAPVPLGV
jgi:site-specific DNA-methyltransferase (adenine-specific)